MKTVNIKTVEINIKDRSFRLKESDFTFIGIAVTVILYIMNVLGTGIIVGGDVGRIGKGIPFYGFVASVLFIAFAVFMGYYTKKHSLKSTFIATYITLALPFAAYPLVFAFNGTYLMLIPMYLCMPALSLVHYLNDNLCDLLEGAVDAIAASMDIASYKVENCIFVLTVAVLLIPLIAAPVVYRFTKVQENED